MTRVRTASVAIVLMIALLFAASVGPSLDWSDSHAIGVAWTQLSGLLSVLLMSVVVILSARPRVLERAMAGLDKMYRLHKWLGIGGILFGILHWLTATGDGHRPPPGTEAAATTSSEPATTAADATSGVLQSLTGPAHEFAQPVLFLLIALGLIALISRIPYRWFVKSHIVTVPAFLFFIFHSVVLMKTDYWSLPVSWISVAVMALSVPAAIYGVFHFAGLTHTTRATVTGSTYFPEIRVLEAVLKVDPSWPGHKAGQFVFAATDRHEGAHPFTIASTWRPERGTIRLIAKELGDHTARLRAEYTEGREVRLEGPYGHFTFDDDKPRQIWIGAGIGITPFVARMEHRANNPDGKIVDLFHPTTEESSGALDRLRADAKASNTAAHVLVSPRDGRLDFAAIAKAVPEWSQASVWFCGPPLFGAALRKQFIAAGLSAKDWHQELFEMR